MRALLLSRPAPSAEPSGRCARSSVPRRSPPPARSRSTSRPAASAAPTCTSSRARSGAPLPIVPGHQAAGRIAAVGADVEGLAAGDRVGVGWMAWVCGSCRFCESGRENLCERARFTGRDRDGGYAERMMARRALGLSAAARDLAARRRRRCSAPGSSDTARCGCPESVPAAGSASSASARRRTSRSRSRATGAARSTRSPAKRTTGSSPSRWARRGRAGRTTTPGWRSTRR